jgi:hypothetical protein
MRIVILLACVLALSASADMGDILKQFSAPAGNPDGLTYLDGYLWITSDVGFTIFQVDTADGSMNNYIPGHGEGNLTGLTTDETDLYSCCTGTPTAYIYRREIPSGTVLDSIPAPHRNSEGLAWDGTYLWNTNYTTDSIYQLDPTTGEVLDKYYPNNPDGCTGLVYDGYFLWATFQGSQMIYKMIPGDPVPVAYCLAPCEIPQDLAWDGQYLWLTEYVADDAQIYKVDPGPLGFDSYTWGSLKASFE